MPKLSKQIYIANNEKRINCYTAHIPKRIVQEAEIDDDDEINIRVEYDKIIIEKRYYYTCMECGYEWQDGKSYSITSNCPKCGCGDLRCVDLRECNDDNKK